MRRRPQPEAPSPDARKRQLAHELDELVAAGHDVRGHPLLEQLRELAPVVAERLASGLSAYVDPFNPEEDTP